MVVTAACPASPVPCSVIGGARPVCVNSSLTIESLLKELSIDKNILSPLLPPPGTSDCFPCNLVQHIIQMDLPLSERRCTCILEAIITCCLGFTAALFCLDSAESCRELVRSES